MYIIHIYIYIYILYVYIYIYYIMIYAHHRLTVFLAFWLFIISGIRLWGGGASSRCSRSRLWRSRSSCFLASPAHSVCTCSNSDTNLWKPTHIITHHRTPSSVIIIHHTSSNNVIHPHTHLSGLMLCAHMDVLFIFTEQSCTILGSEMKAQYSPALRFDAEN